MFSFKKQLSGIVNLFVGGQISIRGYFLVYTLKSCLYKGKTQPLTKRHKALFQILCNFVHFEIKCMSNIYYQRQI